MSPLRYIQAIEQMILQRDSRTALDRMGRLLAAFSAEEEPITTWVSGARPERARQVFTRLAAAITSVFVDPKVELTKQDFQRFSTVMPEIAHVFSISGYGNSDHLLETILGRGQPNGAGTNFANQSDARKFLLCSSIYGQSVGPLVGLLERAPQATLSSVLRALSAHVSCEPTSQQHRNQLLDAIRHATDAQPSNRMLWDIHRAWTLCSYATTEDRHTVKRHLNRLIINWLESRGFAEPQRKSRLSAGRPTLVVACEVAGGGHVMSRCYEPFFEQLQQKFRVIVMIAKDDLGDDVVPWCDELITFDWNTEKFGEVLELIAQQQADVVYYPCVGMRLWSVIACNVRLAPLQIASLGHPATTHSSCIDYMIGGKTTAGEQECFSEKLVPLNSPGNLYRLSRDQERYPGEIDPHAHPLRVATCANMLKLNSDFLAALRRIAESAERAIEFHIMPNCVGLKLGVVRQQVASVLSREARFRVYPRQPCANYLQHLRECHIYLSPFPFGGENSTLDAVLQGLPAVTLHGREPHSRLDARVMQTVGLPGWLITDSVEAYIQAALRLINRDDVRVDIAQQLTDTDLEQLFLDEHQRYANDFVNTMWSIYERELQK